MRTFSFSYVLTVKEDLSESQQQLLQAAHTAAQSAYAPYSEFKVGAAVLLENGQIVLGANHENASYPAGICAERAALAAIPADKNNPVKTIAIAYVPGKGPGNEPLSPCGICRQTILESQQFQGSPITVLMSSPQGAVLLVEDASLLLPFHFGKKFLDENTD